MDRILRTIPFVAIFYCLVGLPLSEQVTPGLLATNRMWPALFLLTVLLAFLSARQLDLSRLFAAPAIILALFIAYAGMTLLWAFSPEFVFKRWVQAVLISVTVALPFTVKRETINITDIFFWAYAIAIAINAIFVMTTPATVDYLGRPHGHTGYFFHKQYLGMCSAIALMLGTYCLISGRHKIAAAVTVAVALWVIFASGSKTALGFSIIAPTIAATALFLRSKLRIPILASLSAIPITYQIVALAKDQLSSRISFWIYGDPTFTGRTDIWTFVESQAALRPWGGWGFNAFWLIPNSPALSAPGFVKDMPCGHSGFLDLRVETGYIGITLFLAFLAFTIHALDRARSKRPAAETWIILTMLVYAMMMNLMETIWFSNFDPLWVATLVIAFDATRQLRSETALDPVMKTKTRAFDLMRARHRFPYLLPNIQRGS